MFKYPMKNESTGDLSVLKTEQKSVLKGSKPLTRDPFKK